MIVDIPKRVPINKTHGLSDRLQQAIEETLGDQLVTHVVLKYVWTRRTDGDKAGVWHAEVFGVSKDGTEWSSGEVGANDPADALFKAQWTEAEE